MMLDAIAPPVHSAFLCALSATLLECRLFLCSGNFCSAFIAFWFFCLGLTFYIGCYTTIPFCVYRLFCLLVCFVLSPILRLPCCCSPVPYNSFLGDSGTVQVPVLVVRVVTFPDVPFGILFFPSYCHSSVQAARWSGYILGKFLSVFLPAPLLQAIHISFFCVYYCVLCTFCILFSPFLLFLLILYRTGWSPFRMHSMGGAFVDANSRCILCFAFLCCRFYCFSFWSRPVLFCSVCSFVSAFSPFTSAILVMPGTRLLYHMEYLLFILRFLPSCVAFVLPADAIRVAHVLLSSPCFGEFCCSACWSIPSVVPSYLHCAIILHSAVLFILLHAVILLLFLPFCSTPDSLVFIVCLEQVLLFFVLPWCCLFFMYGADCSLFSQFYDLHARWWSNSLFGAFQISGIYLIPPLRLFLLFLRSLRWCCHSTCCCYCWIHLFWFVVLAPMPFCLPLSVRCSLLYLRLFLLPLFCVVRCFVLRLEFILPPRLFPIHYLSWISFSAFSRDS